MWTASPARNNRPCCIGEATKERSGATFFGTSAAYVQANMKGGVVPREEVDDGPVDVHLEAAARDPAAEQHRAEEARLWEVTEKARAGRCVSTARASLRHCCQR